VDTPPPLPPWIVDQWPTLPPLETPPPPDEGSVMGRILAMNEGEAQSDTGNTEEGGTVPQESPQSPNSNELESTQQGPPIRTGNTQNSVIVNRRGDPYPRPVDPRTGELMPFPEGPFNWVPEEARVPWNKFERGKFIAEWIRQGYPDYGKGWKDLDIHHILPREWGGTNDFWNLIPVPRELHQGPAPEGITAWWNDFEP